MNLYEQYVCVCVCITIDMYHFRHYFEIEPASLRAEKATV